MRAINVLEAKTNLSRLLESLESGREEEIVIARHGRPVARLTPVARRRAEQRIGVARGKFVVPDQVDDDNALILALFTGSDDAPAP
jgi:prevent-host-death family protein